MPFNSTDFTQPPWTSGVMTLTHEECVEVKAACQKIIDEFEPDLYNATPDDFYVTSKYNEIDWRKGINLDTYWALKQYDVDTMTGGIPYNEENQEESPTEEPTEEPAPTEPPTDEPTDEPTTDTGEPTQGE